jgi:hypothetical protein
MAFAKRLVAAKTLHFGFTPYNASPVSVDFDVAGVDRVTSAVGKTCGRRL